MTPGTEPDLFWALLGCRGSFGVVTWPVTETLPLTSVVGGVLWFTGDVIAPAVHRGFEWTGGLPGTMNSSVLLMRLPEAGPSSGVGTASSCSTPGAHCPPRPITSRPRPSRPACTTRWSLGIGAVTPAFLAGPHVTRTDLRSTYVPRDLARLRDVKRAWDPEDMFRVTQVGTTADLSDG